MSAGATDVKFSKPVVNYTDNFLELPVGTDVPTGYYDRDKGEWLGGPDGRVIKILAEAGDKAQLDVDGDGQADGADKYGPLGVDDAELQRLAVLYDPGKTLWRVQVTHFSPWDYNYPYGPPPGAGGPGSPGPNGGPGPDGPCGTAGSIVLCESQTLGERLAIQGTNLTLNYRSDRVPGRTDAFSFDMPASGASLPPNVEAIEINVDVAGRTIHDELPAAPNQTYHFTWDGNDAYGRKVQGAVPATVRLGYRYKAVYLKPEEFQTSWSRYAGVPVSGDKARQTVSFFQEFETTLGIWDATAVGLGGWTLSQHHAYDPGSRTLYLGNGERRSADSQAVKVLKPFAGQGFPNPGNVGDAGPALDANLNAPHGMAVGPDGSLYIADTEDERVRRVAPDHTISTVAGNGTFGLSGDGGVATNARVASPEGLDIADDGSLYIADTKNNRIRRVGTDGKIATVAGGGSPADGLGDDGPATQARLAGPTDVAVAADGTIYIADRAHHRVRMVSPDGTITSVAGGTEGGFDGDGGPAGSSLLNLPTGVALAPDGTLYIADAGNDRVRRVRVDGTIDTVAGGGSPASGVGDEGPATDAKVEQPTALDVGQDGAVYVAERAGNRVRRVIPDGTIATAVGGGDSFGEPGGAASDAQLSAPSGVAFAPSGALYVAERDADQVQVATRLFEGFSQGDLLIPAADGRQIYQFNRNGRHLRTLDSLTGAPQWTFGYDGAGRLVSAQDVGGRTTTIERSAGGAPTALVAPGGQRTELALTAGGYLASLTNPANETVAFGYGTGGLLTSMTDPNGGESTFGYDSRGRLTSTTDAGGAVRTLTREDLPDGNRVTLATDLNHSWIYRFQKLPSGGSRSTVTDPAGAATVTLRGSDGSTTVTYPDGTESRTEMGPDPTLGLAAPVVSKRVDTLPGGHERTTKQTRDETFSDPGDLFSLTEVTDTVNVNGRTASTHYDAATRTLTNTSAEGRVRTSVLDNRGRVVSLEMAPGQDPITTTFDSQGRIAQMKQGSEKWDYTYDVLDRVVARTDANGKSIGYAYDDADRLTTLTLPSGKAYHYGYDENGNRTSVLTPLATTHTLGYTPMRLAQSYLPPGAGAAFTRSYDTERKLTKNKLPSGREVTRGYDAGARLATVSDPDTDVAFSYVGSTDRAAQVSATPDGGGTAQTVAFGYDGQLTTSADFAGPASGEYDFSYDDNFWLTGTTLTAGPDVASSAIARDDDGRVTAIGPFNVGRAGPAGTASSYSDGTQATELGYDTNGRVNQRRLVANGTQRYKATLTRGADGKITKKVEVVGGTSTTYDYVYDDDGQLTRVDKDGATAEQYGYDDNGNRTSRHVGLTNETATYDGQDRLTNLGGTTYGFDSDGLLGTRGTDSFDYDARGELLSATVGGTTVSYRYDGIGRRVSRTQNGQTTQYLYGDPGDAMPAHGGARAERPAHPTLL